MITPEQIAADKKLCEKAIAKGAIAYVKPCWRAPEVLDYIAALADKDARIAALEAENEELRTLLGKAKTLCVHEYHCAISEAGMRHGCTCEVGGLDELIDAALARAALKDGGK